MTNVRFTGLAPTRPESRVPTAHEVHGLDEAAHMLWVGDILVVHVPDGVAVVLPGVPDEEGIVHDAPSLALATNDAARIAAYALMRAEREQNVRES